MNTITVLATVCEMLRDASFYQGLLQTKHRYLRCPSLRQRCLLYFRFWLVGRFAANSLREHILAYDRLWSTISALSTVLSLMRNATSVAATVPLAHCFVGVANDALLPNPKANP